MYQVMLQKIDVQLQKYSGLIPYSACTASTDNRKGFERAVHVQALHVWLDFCHVSSAYTVRGECKFRVWQM